MTRAAIERSPSRSQRVLDHLLFPANMWFSEETSARLGLTPIDHERLREALRHCRGRLLDVACGDNRLVRNWGDGVGCDIHPYAGIDARADSAALPFGGGTFDTVALLACLNHITRRRETLAECRRVLRPGGRLVVTMIPAWVGFFSHRIRYRHDPDQRERGMSHEEDWGLSTRSLLGLFADAGFRLIHQGRFMWGLNGLYVAERA